MCSVLCTCSARVGQITSPMAQSHFMSEEIVVSLYTDIVNTCNVLALSLVQDNYKGQNLLESFYYFFPQWGKMNEYTLVKSTTYLENLLKNWPQKIYLSVFNISFSYFDSLQRYCADSDNSFCNGEK